MSQFVSLPHLATKSVPARGKSMDMKNPCGATTRHLIFDSPEQQQFAKS